MANTTMSSSNKCDPVVFDVKKLKNSTAVRRLLHILKNATFKNRQNDADFLKLKANHNFARCTPEPSITEGEQEATQAEVEEPKEPTGSNRPSSPEAPKSRLTLTIPSEPLHPTLTPVSENTTSPNIPEASSSSSPSVIANKNPRTKPSKSRRPAKTTMITPELMRQIQTSNRKHSGASLLNGGELHTKTLGTATATNRAKEVLASPLRWSEQ